MRKTHEYKETEIGRIPREWEVGRLGNKRIADLIMGQSPPSSTYSDKGLGLPFLQGNAEFGEMYPTPLLSCSQPTKLSEKNDILLSVRAPVGDVNISPYKLCIGRGLAAIRPKKDKLNYLFLFYCLKFGSRIFESLSMGSTFKAIRKEEVEKFKLPLPPLPEQKKIAEILMTADEAIQKVDEAIEKTQRLKKGLMQELLTKGIGHNVGAGLVPAQITGQPQGIAPTGKRQKTIHNGYKDTEIGRIPKEWEVAKLDEVAEINKETIDPTRSFPNNKFLYIDIDSVENGTGIIKGSKEILGKDAPSRARRVIHHNDVLMSTVRPYLKAFTIIPRELNNQICSTGFAVLTCKEKTTPFYLLYTIFSKTVIDQCNKMMVGGQYPALSSSQVEKIKIPLPPLPEQKKISEILSTVDKKLELLRGKKGRFERVKRGSMEDLLRGRKRVKT